MAHTNPKTTNNLVSVAKQITKSTYLISKPRKVNYAHIYSNIPTVMEIIR